MAVKRSSRKGRSAAMHTGLFLMMPAKRKRPPHTEKSKRAWPMCIKPLPAHRRQAAYETER